MCVSILLIDLCLVTFYAIALFLLLLNSTNLCLPAKITYLTFCCGFRIFGGLREQRSCVAIRVSNEWQKTF